MKSYRVDRPGSRPVRIAHSLEIHLEEPDRFLAGHNSVADLPPLPALDDRRVADSHRPGGDFPDVAIGRGREHEIAVAALSIRVQGVSTRGRIIGDSAERIEGNLATRIVAATLDDLHRTGKE